MAGPSNDKSANQFLWEGEHQMPDWVHLTMPKTDTKMKRWTRVSQIEALGRAIGKCQKCQKKGHECKILLPMVTISCSRCVQAGQPCSHNLDEEHRKEAEKQFQMGKEEEKPEEPIARDVAKASNDAGTETAEGAGEDMGEEDIENGTENNAEHMEEIQADEPVLTDDRVPEMMDDEEFVLMDEEELGWIDYEELISRYNQESVLMDNEESVPVDDEERTLMDDEDIPQQTQSWNTITAQMIWNIEELRRSYMR